MVFRKLAANLVLATLIASSLVFMEPATSSNQASATEVTLACRSANGTGALPLTDALRNGFFEKEGIRITPVFSKRMYVDVSRGFDATYIAYRVTNVSGGPLNNLTIELTDFQGSVVSPATDADTFRRIGTLTNNSSLTAYFLIRATTASLVNHRHNVRVNEDDGLGTKTEKAACYTDIEGVKRSLSASANKVTSIFTPQTAPALGSTFDVIVAGAPGKVGNGENPDGSIIAFSPASQSSWPSKAIRLENVEVTVRGIQSQSTASSCVSSTIDGTGLSSDGASSGTGLGRTFVVSNRLVLRQFGSCASTSKQTYEVKYTFRVLSSSGTNPVIRPLASISSGTQIKYTGSLPSTEVKVPLEEITYPIDVVKSFVSSAKHPTSGDVTHADVTYRITATTTSADPLTIDEFRDDPPGELVTGGELISAKFTDTTRTDTSINKIDSEIGGQVIWRFIGPFSLSSAQSAVLEYVVRYPVPTETTVRYTNLGYTMQGGIQVGSSGLTTGVEVEVGSDGGTTDTVVREKAPQKITFPQPSSVGLNSSTVIAATSDSSLPVSFSSVTEAVCSVAEAGGVWFLYAIQETNLAENIRCTIRAFQNGDTKFEPATDVFRDVTILRGQVITASSQNFQSDNKAQITVSATSKLPVLLASLDTDVCTVAITTSHNSETGVSIWTATSKTSGACILVATQAGDETWGPAPERDIRIGSGTSQTLRYLNPSNLAQQDSRTEFAQTLGSFTIVATSLVTSTLSNATPTKAQLPVSLRSTTPTQCRVEYTTNNDGELLNGYDGSGGQATYNTTLTVTMLAAGTCTIEASQDGTKDDGTASSYAPAENVSISYLIKASGTTAQVLTFEAIATKTYGDAGFNARVDSKTTGGSLTNLLVQVSSNTPDICEVGSSSISSGVSQAMVYLKAAGPCELRGVQGGNGTYASATTSISFTVGKKSLTVTGLSIATRQYDGGTSATLSGTSALQGVVPGDSLTEISLTGTASVGSFDSPDVTVSPQVFTVSGLSLLGTKAASSYLLTAPTVSGSISARSITISFPATTISSTPEIFCLDKIQVSSGTLVEGQSVTAITCNLPTFGTGYTADTSSTITPSLAVIKQGGINGDERTNNYTVTYQAGLLSISGLKIATLVVEDMEVIYGEVISSLETETTIISGESNKPKARDNENNLIAGQLKHKKNGSVLAAELTVADHDVVVEFVPDDKSYATITTSRKIKVLPRPLKLTGLQAVSKEYDGTRTASFSGALGLGSVPGNAKSGKVGDDDVTVNGDASSASGEFNSANAGETVAVSSVTGLSLTGAKAANYRLEQVTGLSATITRKPLKLGVVKQYAKLKGDPDPTFEVSVDATKGFVAGEGLSTIGGAAVSRASLTDTPGTPVALNVVPGNAAGENNYELELVSGILHISDVVITVTNDSDGSPSTVTCECENLKDGEQVTLTMFSTPTVIGTTTVVDGECPFSNALTLPESEGDHTLELTSVFPNGESVTQSMEISFLATSGSPPQAFSSGSSALLPPTLLITDAKFKKATAAWLPAIGDVAGYRLYIDGKLVQSFGPNARRAKLKGLTKDTLYRATLVAVDRANRGALSQADFFTMNQRRLTIYFSGDSPRITRQELARLKRMVRSLPSNYRAELTVVATVKRIPGRSFASNKALADARARNVSAALRKLGLQASLRVVGVGVPESAADRSRKAASMLRYVRLI
jgi:hypothetical protein